MAEEDVQVKFGVEIAALAAGTTVAKSEIMKVVEAIAILQKSVHATSQSMTTELVAAISNMRAQASSAAPQVKRMADEVANLSTAGHGGHGTIFGMQTGVFLELRALLDEALAGRMRNFEGSFARLTGMIAPTIAGFAAANPLLAGFGAAAAVAGGGLAYLIYEAIAYKDAWEQIQAQGAIDQLQLTAAAAGDVAAAISKAGDISYSNAAKFAAPFLELGPGGEKIAQIASYYLPLYTKAGEDAGKAGEKLASVFVNLKTKGADYVAATVNMTSAQKQAFEAARQAGDVSAQYMVVLQAMQARLGAATDAMVEQKTALAEIAAGIGEVSEFGESFVNVEDRMASAATKAAEAIRREKDAQSALSSEAAKELATSGVIAAKKAADADKIVEKVNAESTKVKELRGEYQQLAEQLSTIDTSTAQGYARAKAIWDAQKRIQDQIRESSEKDSSGPISENAFQRAQQQIRELEATYKGMKSTLLTQEISILGLSKRGNGVPDDSKEGQQFNNEIAAKRKEAAAAGTEEYIRSEQIKTAASRSGTAERLALANKEKAAKTATYGAGSPEAQSAVLAAVNAERAADDERRANQAAGIDDEIANLKRATQERLRNYADDVRNHRASAQQGAAEAQAALQSEQASLRNFYLQKRALAAGSAAELRAIARQEANDNRQIDSEILQQQRQAADAQAKAWKDSADTVAGAINGQVNGMLRGTTSVSQAFKNMAATGIEDAIKAVIKWGLEHTATVAMNVAGLGVQTAATTAATATQTATLAAGMAAQKAINATAVQGDAGRAAAGAYAAVAGIPIIGPVLAPAAAAVAFGAVEAFGSFDVGSWQLPGDTLAQVHKGEMIVPAAATPWAQSLMANAAAGNSGGSGGGDTHHHWNIASNARDPREVAKEVADVFVRNPSLRPRY